MYINMTNYKSTFSEGNKAEGAGTPVALYDVNLCEVGRKDFGQKLVPLLHHFPCHIHPRAAGSHTQTCAPWPSY